MKKIEGGEMAQRVMQEIVFVYLFTEWFDSLPEKKKERFQALLKARRELMPED